MSRKESQSVKNPPHALVGAGDLVSGIWKVGQGDESYYRFNVYRLARENGAVLQFFDPGNVADLVKLCQVLASVLADDGCLPESRRRELAVLARLLDRITRSPE